MTPYRDRLNAGYYQDNNIVWGEKEEPTIGSETIDLGTAIGYTCDECGKTFTSQHGLTVHQGKTHA